MSNDGLKTDEYRADMREDGQPVRVWSALLSSSVDPVMGTADPAISDHRDRNNLIYSELALDAAVRVFVGDERNITESAQFGLIRTGSIMLSAMPDEMSLSRGDRLLATEMLSVTNYNVVRGSGGSDALQRPFVVAFLKVFDASRVYVAGTDYQLTANADATQPFAPDSITWLGGGQAPTAGKSYGVAHTYRPLYIVLGDNDTPARPDSNGALLPAQYRLQLAEAGV